jgi:hypothetical protein
MKRPRVAVTCQASPADDARSALAVRWKPGVGRKPVSHPLRPLSSLKFRIMKFGLAFASSMY